MPKKKNNVNSISKQITESTKNSGYSVYIPKSAKKKIVRKSKVLKTKNHGTFTEAQFFNWLRQKLRRASLVWKPISECKKRAKIPYSGDNKRRKVSYVCESCKGEFDSKSVSVDHKLPIGSLQNYSDLPQFVERLFCEIENLQLLCSDCHSVKTKLDNSKLKENDTT